MSLTYCYCTHSFNRHRGGTGPCDGCDCEAFNEKPELDRDHYHDLLDQAMDESKEGESFLPRFVGLVIAELTPKRGTRSCDDHADCDKAMAEEIKRGGTCLHHPKKDS